MVLERPYIRSIALIGLPTQERKTIQKSVLRSQGFGEKLGGTPRIPTRGPTLPCYEVRRFFIPFIVR
ncbi:MAG: hypothetical protein UY72_C0009G0005 [Candidatus Uhrbacteria bacterium GW2011_GWD2_52_7]|uniref:Uncharacterized protein n=1 Tax=Candidatus Uhrbacteria bacterium GW2011_GWD2_52_7 TaxID=1618989 RepID=A0A0G1ZQM4_9BACT|nr:MAG: hypothetical protein UY72_C0009G0005 [Candidatus Uhrbacteria bacterium GW2011_GWD2_52_7]